MITTLRVGKADVRVHIDAVREAQSALCKNKLERMHVTLIDAIISHYANGRATAWRDSPPLPTPDC